METDSSEKFSDYTISTIFQPFLLQIHIHYTLRKNFLRYFLVFSSKYYTFAATINIFLLSSCSKLTMHILNN